MKETKKFVIGIIVLYLVLIGLLTPEKSYAASDSDFVIKNVVLVKYQGYDENVVIPDGIKEIGIYAFAKCSYLTKVEMPNSITAIGFGAFSDCSGLTSMVIPDGVTEIGGESFYNCSNLGNIEISDSVTVIGGSAFTRTAWLDEKRMERSDHLVIVNNILADGLMATGNVQIPDGVTEIIEDTFSFNKNLTSITIPNSVTRIGDFAFLNCSKLNNVEIQNSVMNIGYEAFKETSWLDKKRIERDDYLVIINNILLDGVKSQGAVNIPDGIFLINAGAFVDNSNINSVIIPASVKEIGLGAFCNCSELKEVRILNGITTIGMDTFVNCTKLKNINIPNSVIKIESGAFYMCSALKEITFPKQIKKLEFGTIEGCDALNKITFLNKNIVLLGLNEESVLDTIFGLTHEVSGKIKKRTLTICSYNYSTADDFAVYMNTLQATENVFGIKSVKFIPLDKRNSTLDKIKVPASITIKKSQKWYNQRYRKGDRLRIYHSNTSKWRQKSICY